MERPNGAADMIDIGEQERHRPPGKIRSHHPIMHRPENDQGCAGNEDVLAWAGVRERHLRKAVCGAGPRQCSAMTP